MIDARSLHNWLGCGRTFGAWVRGRIEEYGFEEGVDFIPVSEKTRGRPRTDYLLTLDTAKELAMVERTEVGRDTRRYFIGMEKAAVFTAAGEKTPLKKIVGPPAEPSGRPGRGRVPITGHLR